MGTLAFALVGTNDHQRAFQFYDRVLAKIDVYPALTLRKMRYYGKTWQNGGPIFGVTKPINREPALAGNGNMISFRVDKEEMVDAMYAEAIALGATCAGKPGVLRQNESYRFYGAYFKDLDGNKIEVFRGVFFPDGHVEIPDWRKDLPADQQVRSNEPVLP